jgi:hypothetical protein
MSTRGARTQRGTRESVARLDDHSGLLAVSGCKRGQFFQRLGSFCGGPTTKIHVAVNDEGQAVMLHQTKGKQHDETCAEISLEYPEASHVIANK